MKRQHLIASLFAISGVILAIYHRSDTVYAISTLILCSVVALSICFRGKHPYLSRGFVPTWALMGLSALTIGSGLFLLHDKEAKDVQKPNALEIERANALFTESNEAAKAAPAAGNSAPANSRSFRTRPRPRDLDKEVLEVMISEDFTKQVKAGFENGTPPEALTSFSNFLKYLESQGVTVPGHDSAYFTNLFEKRFPGQSPADLDAEMKQQLLSYIEAHGHEEGTRAFSQEPENALWLAARFDLLADEGKSMQTWREQMLADNFGATTPGGNPHPAQTSALSPNSIETGVERQAETHRGTATALQARGDSEAPAKASTIPGFPDSGEPTRAPVSLEAWMSEHAELPTEEAFETGLRERFSPKRLNTALETLNRYGPEEGIRRLKESDPELAEQFQRRLPTDKERE